MHLPVHGITTGNVCTAPATAQHASAPYAHSNIWYWQANVLLAYPAMLLVQIVENTSSNFALDVLCC
jgi:hypothetical protein